MEPFLYHVFVCDQKKPEGVPGCMASGSGAVIEALQREIAGQGMIDEVQLTTCGSLGLCEHGPNMIVYPEGIWYCRVSPADVPEIVCSHFKEGIPVERLMRTEASLLRAEILSNRKKRELAMRAREASGALPEEWMQTIRGYQESRVFLSAIELDLFSAVGGGASAHEVASRLRTDPRATEALLHALTAMGMLEKRNAGFYNTAAGKRFLTDASAENAREGLMHQVHLWSRWSNLTDCVRLGAPVIEQETGERKERWTGAFIAAMDRIAAERAPSVVRAVSLEGVHRMLDVGGGSGAYAIAFARCATDLKVEILDLPDVLPLTCRHIDQAGLSARIRTRAGDLRTDPLGSGFDLVLVSAICHMLDPSQNLDLIRRCHQALAPAGRLVIQDFILEPDKTAPKSGALFAINMLVGTAGGSSYSVDEYSAWLKEAGFREPVHTRLPGPSSLLIASR